jgi:hypothetical protein
MDQNTESVAISDVTEEVRPINPRDAAIEAINAVNLERIEEEIGHSLRPSEESPAVDEPDEPVEEVAPVVQKVKVKVDGIEQEVELDGLVRDYQKFRAADRRLEEAAMLLRQAEERARQVDETQTQNTQAVAETSGDLRNQAANVLDLLYDGDKDSAAEALVSLMAKARGGDQPTPTQQPVDEANLAARVIEQMAINTAFEKVQVDYPDLLADEDILYITASKIDKAVASGTPRSKAIIEVSEAMYKTLGKQSPGRQQATKADGTTRRDNKARLDNIPTASASAIPPESPYENQSVSSVIADLARKRLGQTLSL